MQWFTYPGMYVTLIVMILFFLFLIFDMLFSIVPFYLFIAGLIKW